jgi:hypothetical protein
VFAEGDSDSRRAVNTTMNRKPMGTSERDIIVRMNEQNQKARRSPNNF